MQLLVRVCIEMHLEALPNWQPSHLALILHLIICMSRTGPLSRQEVQVSNRLIAKDNADGAREKAEVQNEAIKQLQNSVNYSMYS